MATTVLHVFSGDLWAGAEVMIANLLGALRSCDDVRVVALSLNEGELARRLRHAGVETHVVPETAPFAAVVVRSIRIARQIRADIIHSHRYKENLLAWTLAKTTGTRALIATLHGMPEAVAGGADTGARALRRATDLMLLKRRFVTVAVSEDMRRLLVERHGFSEGRVRVIHNGVTVPTNPVSPARRAAQEIHVGTVARLVPVKALDLFVEAAGLVARKDERARFSILGDGPLRDPLLALATARGLGQRLRLLPPVPDPSEYYRSLHVYVNTSLHEGLPMSVVEAMAHGTPVVAARVGGIPEVVQDGEQGFLVEGRDPADFAQRILELGANEGRRHLLGERAAARALQHFSASAMGEQYRTLYREQAPSTIAEEGRVRCG